jgi:hypothetical protein
MRLFWQRKKEKNLVFEVKAPNMYPTDSNYTKIFLAGTIDMGDSEDWQKKVLSFFEQKKTKENIALLNPRRDKWNKDWKQTIENRNFYNQVKWELDALACADIIIMNFLPDSQSPISLLELGLYAKSTKIYVCCPKEFYRSGNVHIVCERYGIPLFENLDELLKSL